jgi:hypothetical protein
MHGYRWVGLLGVFLGAQAWQVGQNEIAKEIPMRYPESPIARFLVFGPRVGRTQGVGLYAEERHRLG